MREVLPLSSLTWLSSGPIPISDPSGVLGTFRAGAADVVRFKGPHKLYRAAGWDSNRRQMNSAYGSYWADERLLADIGAKLDQFAGWLPQEMLNHAWPVQYRGLAALCEDWNDMRQIFRLDLPAGEELVGLVGPAAQQPQRSWMDPRLRTTPILSGGGEQVYFKRTTALNSINPLWVLRSTPW